MDPSEGRRYVELVKEEVVGGWDHAYQISEDCVQPTIDEEMGWRSSSSTLSYFDDALENWHNRIHEVSIQKCRKITQSLN